MSVNRATGNEFARSALRKTDVFLGPEQDHIRERRLDRIANPARPVRTGDGRRRRLDTIIGIAPSEIAQVRWIDRQIARERSTERFVGGDQNAQPLVDLAVHPLAALLNREHHHETNADTDQRHQRQTDQRDEQALPGAEVDVAQRSLLTSIERTEQQSASDYSHSIVPGGFDVTS